MNSTHIPTIQVKSNRKIMIIGLDGASLDLIEPWANEGYLPTFARLMKDGAYTRLESVMPTVTAAAWPSFFTGLNPGKTGAYDFVRREASSYRLRVLSRNQIHGEPFWQILGNQGYRVGIINVPLTYPPDVVNGFMVSGLGTPDNQLYTYPPELAKELNLRGYRVNKRESYYPRNEADYLREVYSVNESLYQSTAWLLAREGWQAFMVVFYDTDQLASYFWRHMDPTHPLHNPATDLPYANAIREFYQKIDKYIGSLISLAGQDTNVLIMSDHGAGPLYRDIYLNEWLRQNGYLAVKGSNPHLPQAQRVAARIGLTRQNISRKLREARLEKLESRLKDVLGKWVEILPKNQRPEFFNAVDWEQTLAYSFGFQGQIYINLKEREPNGTVSPGADYEQLCTEIIDRLKDLVDPLDGFPVVDRIFRKEELYTGPYLEYAPDLLLVMRNLSYFTHLGYEFSDTPGRVIDDLRTHESGGHRLHGILFAIGPDFHARGFQEEPAKLLDLAPTILYLMDCAIPTMMDGRVLVKWITKPIPPMYVDGSAGDGSLVSSSYTDDEETELINRLKSLGYLE